MIGSPPSISMPLLASLPAFSIFRIQKPEVTIMSTTTYSGSNFILTSGSRDPFTGSQVPKSLPLNKTMHVYTTQRLSRIVQSDSMLRI